MREAYESVARQQDHYRNEADECDDMFNTWFNLPSSILDVVALPRSSYVPTPQSLYEDEIKSSRSYANQRKSNYSSKSYQLVD